jgi:hypothetical protein
MAGAGHGFYAHVRRLLRVRRCVPLAKCFGLRCLASSSQANHSHAHTTAIISAGSAGRFVVVIAGEGRRKEIACLTTYLTAA